MPRRRDSICISTALRTCAASRYCADVRPLAIVVSALRPLFTGAKAAFAEFAQKRAASHSKRRPEHHPSHLNINSTSAQITIQHSNELRDFIFPALDRSAYAPIAT
jgi:hypothetical protein